MERRILKYRYFVSVWFFLFLLLSVISFPVNLHAKKSSSTSLLKQADICRKSLYRSKKLIKYRHNWLRCIRKYELVQKRYPKSPEAPWALYKAGKMFMSLYKYSGKKSDLDEAIDYFERIVKGYEKHRLADDAQFKIGEIYYKYKKDYSRAYLEFLKIDLKFPHGDMRMRAQQRLDHLARILSTSSLKTKTANLKKKKLVLVQNIRYWSTTNYTRVVIDLEAPVKYSSHMLKGISSKKIPPRLYVDLKSTRIPPDFKDSIPIAGSLLKRARAAQHDEDTVRVVLDINSISGYKIFHLYNPFRIVMDVHGKKHVVKSPKKTETPKSKKTPKKPRKGIRKAEEEPDLKVSLARQLGLHVKTIVLDPGHGGNDTGCYLNSRIKEKDIVLKLSKIVAEKLRKKLGCKVLLTRKSDKFLLLEQRTAFANVNRADLFISLHVNSYPKNSRVHGIETYFLNMATDERAVMVAARENATSMKNISDLESILNDLLLNTKIAESNKLAHELQNSIVRKLKRRYSRVKSLGVKQAPFYVLIGAEMPAVLIETGFITNSTERKRLLSTKYLNYFAEGISEGIESYIRSIEKGFSS